MERSDFAIHLVEERTRLGFSRENFAVQTNISSEGLRLYETGQRGMSAEFLAAASELGVDVQYVLTGVRSNNLDKVEKKAHTELEKKIIENQIKGNISNSVIAGSGSTIHHGSTINNIHTTQHTTRTIADVKPGVEHITNSQAATLQSLVNDVVEMEAKVKRVGKTHRAVWSSLNHHCGVPTYKLILLSDFEKAEKYLRTWLGRLSSAKSAPKKDETWRKRKYAYIKINIANGLEGWFDSYLNAKFGAFSLTELSDTELQKAYTAVAAKKRSKNK